MENANSYFPPVNSTNSITIPVDMPTDSDMDDDYHGHSSNSQQDPTSPLSVPSSYGTPHDTSFLSHSLPTYHNQQASLHGSQFSGAPSNANQSSTASQARSSSLYMSSADAGSGSPPPFDPASPLRFGAGPMNPGAMSFEELFSMYASGAAVGTPPGNFGTMESSLFSSLLQNQNAGGNDASLSHINPSQLISQETGNFGTSPGM